MKLKITMEIEVGNIQSLNWMQDVGITLSDSMYAYQQRDRRRSRQTIAKEIYLESGMGGSLKVEEIK